MPRLESPATPFIVLYDFAHARTGNPIKLTVAIKSTLALRQWTIFALAEYPSQEIRVVVVPQLFSLQCGYNGCSICYPVCPDWKSDRMHRCTRFGRCVKDMDHSGPWWGINNMASG